jgi:hypothetical protein
VIFTTADFLLVEKNGDQLVRSPSQILRVAHLSLPRGSAGKSVCATRSGRKEPARCRRYRGDRWSAAPTPLIVLTLLAPQWHILASCNDSTSARSPEAHEKFL